MGTAVRLAGFGAALALVFAAAWAAGSLLGPPPVIAAAPADTHAAGAGHAADGHGHDTPDVVSDGLVTTAAGYALVPQVTTFGAGVPGEFAFTVTGSDGRPVTAFDMAHERRLHLIVLRRDTAGFQHLHPALGPDGVWRVPLVLPAGGVYRAYADFVPTGGPALVLGTDLYVPGDFAPVTHPPSRVAQVEGYQVRLDGDLVPGRPSPVVATISLDGVPVTDLEPHLGAFGHLVTLRGGDLAYLHAHPDAADPAATDRAGPGIAFTVDVPSTGEYRLFLDFHHAGVVRTAEFTVTAGGAS
ncbi:MAG TPA: hypothetical protein VEZ42_10740 [Pseudonocardia sp.]|nr:hypothetical protein [Pseudonocardia sp.]